MRNLPILYKRVEAMKSNIVIKAMKSFTYLNEGLSAGMVESLRLSPPVHKKKNNIEDQTLGLVR